MTLLFVRSGSIVAMAAVFMYRKVYNWVDFLSISIMGWIVSTGNGKDSHCCPMYQVYIDTHYQGHNNTHVYHSKEDMDQYITAWDDHYALPVWSINY